MQAVFLAGFHSVASSKRCSKTQRPKNLQGRRSVTVLTAVSVSRFGARIAIDQCVQGWFLGIYDTLRRSVRGHGRFLD